MEPSYHYHLRVPSGVALEIRRSIGEFASVSARSGEFSASGAVDETHFCVVSDRLESVGALKAWSDANSAHGLTLINQAGTPFIVGDTDATSLRSSVEG